ncbi:MAG: hypothetical protein QME51_02665 [Planctomycetota bacterium]|nr:hypothetical protein [Planctomycetota bacterium]MDI6787257.1 hypothetical protein [Planctomycetota bacterium]
MALLAPRNTLILWRRWRHNNHYPTTSQYQYISNGSSNFWLVDELNITSYATTNKPSLFVIARADLSARGNLCFMRKIRDCFVAPLLAMTDGA